MINELAYLSTQVNERKRTLSKSYTIEQQKLIQIVYFLYIDNPDIHLEEDKLLKIGTCTLNRFEDRIIEHARNFSSRISIIDFCIIQNASQEKEFHKFMDKEHPDLVLSVELVNGNFKELYVYDNTVVDLFNNWFHLTSNSKTS